MIIIDISDHQCVSTLARVTLLIFRPRKYNHINNRHIQTPGSVWLCAGISCFITFLHLVNVLVQHDSNGTEWSLAMRQWGYEACVRPWEWSCTHVVSFCLFQALILHKNNYLQVLSLIKKSLFNQCILMLYSGRK